MRAWPTLVLASLALLIAQASQADDGNASLAAGGIVFVKSSAIRMANEDLYVSPALVRVRFEFANDSAKDIETTVAFPLPDIDLYDIWASEVAPSLPRRDPVNFVGFKVSVDGKPVAFETEQRAFVGSMDATEVIAS